ncbi:hypothetical protein [Nocardia sp. NPDC051750]|uniref:hypothetical protein n=1 Tax=Nocardia sp. NPDC051750 TaxID=3364325 RepID=UPI0037A71D79
MTAPAGPPARSHAAAIAPRNPVDTDPTLSMFEDIPEVEVLEEVAAALRSLDHNGEAA